jgi:hypothetical protein
MQIGEYMNIRLQATKYIWIAYTLSMAALFISSTQGNGTSFGAGHVVVAIAASIMAFLSTGTVWNWGNVSAAETLVDAEAHESMKRKHNNKLDRIVSRLSDEERAALIERLEDNMGQYGLSDDGELVKYR